MAQIGMLQRRYTGRPPGRAYEGQIIAIRSNLRWSSDALKMAWWNGEAVRVAFILETCDCEFITWPATSGDIGGEMALNLMHESVERRFGTASLPQPIQRLSDNGGCYRTYEIIDFSVRLGRVPRFTPVRSPQSNGMAEAFVKTFKRDCVYVHDRPDARKVLSQLAAWFEDYNESHPQEALQLKSTREFMRSYQSPAACLVG